MPRTKSNNKGGIMKLLKILIMSAILLTAFAASVFADDFAWMRDLNIQAQADPSGFRASLGTRFQIGDLQVNAVVSNFEDPADAYMALRLGEMSHQPVEYVIEQYKSHKGQGWGKLAQNLGIKPGSPEFHALKAGHDMKGGGGGSHGKAEKTKAHGKGKK